MGAARAPTDAGTPIRWPRPTGWRRPTGWPTLPRRVRVLGGVAILAVLGWRLGAGPFVDGVRRVSGPAMAGALAIGVLTTTLSAWRWQLVARGLGLRLPLPGAVRDYYRALFLNAVLPGGVLGDVHRAVRHGRDAGDVARATTAVVVERSAGQVVLVGAVLTTLLLDPSAIPLPAEFGPGSGPTVTGPTVTGQAGAGFGVAAPVLAAALVVTALVVTTLVVTALVVGTRVVTLRSDRAARLRSLASDARTALRPRAATAAIGVSAVILAGHVATFLLAARTVGSGAPISRLAALALLALLAMSLPLNVGGWGPREGVTAWAFGAAGLGAAQGVSVAVAYGVLGLVASLPGAVLLAAGRPVAASTPSGSRRPVRTR
jgi:uncharacterized membrane protein YbhN (UPF0104 family)